MMIRTTHRFGTVAAILAGTFVVASFASAQEWKAGQASLPAVTLGSSASSESSKDDPDDDSSLIVTSDFNHDGIADIATVTSHKDSSSEPGYLTVLLGQTSGAFREIMSKPVPGRTPRAITTGDFNKDGIPDLIVGGEDGTLTLFLGDGIGNFSSSQEITHLDSVASIAVADFNKDGIEDIAISDWRASVITVLLGTGNGSFGHMWSFPLRTRATVPHIAAADFNGDGIPDLAVIYSEDEADTFDVMLGNGTGTFTLSPDMGFARNPNSHCSTSGASSPTQSQ